MAGLWRARGAPDEQQKKWLRRKPETMLDWMIVVFSAIAFYMLLNRSGYVLGMLNGALDILAPFAGGVP